MSGVRDLESRPLGIRKSRRHLIKVAAIATSALTLKVEQAAANCGHNGKDVGRGCSGGVECFLRGTSIRTTEGDRRVEDLSAGDLLPTFFGGTQAIQWIGRYRFRKADPARKWPRDVVPVRIARSTFGPDKPSTDLFVTQTHALFIDDVLVPVSNLINGTTVTLFDADGIDELEFFHIKLRRHDVIWAEGTPCETLLNVDEKALNFAEYFRLYGQPIGDEASCAPVLGFGCRVELKSHFRSAISPWVDRRQQLDVIRDRLEDGEGALLRLPEMAA